MLYLSLAPSPNLDTFKKWAARWFFFNSQNFTKMNLGPLKLSCAEIGSSNQDETSKTQCYSENSCINRIWQTLMNCDLWNFIWYSSKRGAKVLNSFLEFLFLVWHSGDTTKVNFTNILRIAFTYVSCMCSFFVLTF